jgi:insertion element IS1 protein InsB
MTPRHQPISLATKELIDRLLLEKISLAGIVRATGVSSRWLQYYVNNKLGAVKREVEVKSKKKVKLTIQCDEMWSFVGNKDNKQWKELAIDVSTKEIVGVYIGKRYQAGAQGLWDSCATCLSSMCRKLYRLLECLCHSFSSKKIQGSRKGDWSDKLYRKI